MVGLTRLLGFFIATCHCAVALGDEGELIAGGQLTAHAVQRQNLVPFAGLGGHVLYGLSDFVDVGGIVDCQTSQGARGKAITIQGQSATKYYDAVRCAVQPSIVVRYGSRYILGLQIAGGYGFEGRHTIQYLSPQNIVLREDSSTLKHNLLASSVLSFDIRVVEHVRVGAFADVRIIALGSSRGKALLGGGLRASYAWFP